MACKRIFVALYFKLFYGVGLTLPSCQEQSRDHEHKESQFSGLHQNRRGTRRRIRKHWRDTKKTPNAQAAYAQEQGKLEFRYFVSATGQCSRKTEQPLANWISLEYSYIDATKRKITMTQNVYTMVVPFTNERITFQFKGGRASNIEAKTGDC